MSLAMYRVLDEGWLFVGTATAATRRRGVATEGVFLAFLDAIVISEFGIFVDVQD
jgi:hypothetical protein